tara:strand:+ start:239 stop:415 length:177 start_codon:yes stop_codon:yes gene_type:complete
MDKESINWLIYLINYRKDRMKEECDLNDKYVAECFKAENDMADKVLKELERLQDIGDV